jgi:hypothetical protein
MGNFMNYILPILILVCVSFGAYKLKDSLVAKQKIEEATKSPEVKQAEINAYRMNDVRVFHDDKYHVTCWRIDRTYATAISCIPDKDIN